MSLSFSNKPKAIKKALDSLDKNVLIFAAVSNEGAISMQPIKYPASQEGVFSIYAAKGVTSKGAGYNPERSNTLRYRPFKFLGDKVVSTWTAENIIAMSGTSVATPIAAATAALWIKFARKFAKDDDKLKAIKRKIERPISMEWLFKSFGRSSPSDQITYVTP